MRYAVHFEVRHPMREVVRFLKGFYIFIGIHSALARVFEFPPLFSIAFLVANLYE
jgi:hypothetical protein